MQDLYLPDKDPRLSVERYKRTFEQDEELGLNDIKTENYQENLQSSAGNDINKPSYQERLAVGEVGKEHWSTEDRESNGNESADKAASITAATAAKQVKVKPVLRNSEAAVRYRPLRGASSPSMNNNKRAKYLKFDSKPTVYSSDISEGGFGCNPGGSSVTTDDSEAEECRGLVTEAHLIELGRSGRYLITRDTPSASPVVGGRLGGGQQQVNYQVGGVEQAFFGHFSASCSSTQLDLPVLGFLVNFYFIFFLLILLGF